MSDLRFTLMLGNPRDDGQKPPVVRAWIEAKRDGFSLVMKAEADCYDQRVVDVNFVNGMAEIVSRNLFAPRLCAALGIAMREAVPISAEPSATPNTTDMEKVKP